MKRIAILMSDTGGGHRAAASAITAALELRYPGRCHVQFVDMYRETTVFPLTRAPELYPLWLRHSRRTYVWYWRIFDILFASPLSFRPILGRLFAGSIRRLADTYQPDVLVIVHGGFGRTTVLGRDYAGLDLPICSVVIDPGIPHRAWFHPNTDRCLVPCRDSYARALEAGHRPERLRLVGFPVHPRFAACTASKVEARRQLGWDADRAALLLLGGGEGMGSLEAIARAIDDRKLAAQLAVVCGKNEKLMGRLKARHWHQPPHLHGFMANMELMLRAADLVVTKAGSSSVHEAAVTGTPMIISGAIPYQETGNLQRAVEAGAARDCTQPRQIAEAAEELLRPGNPALARMAAGCRALATPDAVFDVADEIAALVGIGTSVPQMMRA